MNEQITATELHLSPHDIIYTEDIAEAMSPKYLDCCLHLAVTQGEVTFVINGTRHMARKDECIVKPGAEPIGDLQPSPDFEMRGIIASNRFLRLCIQDDSYKTQGLLAMLNDPIVRSTHAEMQVILADIQNIAERARVNYHTFFLQVLKRSLEILILDLQDVHARLNPRETKGMSRSAKIMHSFIGLLQTGLYRRERKVDHYASLLFITPKYLSEACVKASGHNASFWIDRYTTEEISRLMLDSSLTFTQIADQMNFSSINYFTRYVRRTLGMSPTEYRQRMAGKN